MITTPNSTLAERDHANLFGLTRQTELPRPLNSRYLMVRMAFDLRMALRPAADVNLAVMGEVQS